MDEDLDHYLALSSPEISGWSNKDKEYADILKMFRVRQPFSLLLVAKRKFNENDFTNLLRIIMVISFRYNTIGAYSPNEQERVYGDAAGKINNDSITCMSALLQQLNSIYINDERFKNDFAEKSIRTTDSRSKKIVRYILCALEKQLSGNEHDFASDTFNIEHILPQNAPDDWEGFSYEESSAMVYRLGNMTLLKTAINRDLGTESYATKRSEYERSNFVLTQTLAKENSEWSPNRIYRWQKWMAKQASAIWRIDQLSGQKIT